MLAHNIEISESDDDVNSQLARLALSKDALIKIRDRAIYHFHLRNTLNDASNGAGTNLYLEAIQALREEICLPGNNWEKGSDNNVQTIVNHHLGLQIAFSAVDIACSKIRDPQAISPRGPAFSRMCVGADLFDNDPEHSLKEFLGDTTTLVYMIDRDGRAELSLPVISNGNYSDFGPRIFISDGSDFEIPTQADRYDGNDSLNDAIDPNFDVPKR